MKKDKPISKVTLTPNDMWTLSGNNHIDIGIEGYVLPKEILDVRHSKWLKERERILNPKKGQRIKVEPKLDKDGNPLPPPKRPNYLDEVTKWANSFYDKERATKVLEDCEAKGHPLLAPAKQKDPEFKSKDPPKKREFYTDLLIREEQKKYIQIEDRQDLIAEIVEKIKEEKKGVKPWLQKTIEDYATKSEDGKVLIKATFGKGTRASLVSEAEYVGETFPFYNTYVNPDEDDSKKKELFYPSVSYILIFRKHQCGLDTLNGILNLILNLKKN